MVEVFFNHDFGSFGLYPLKISGLTGILTSPFIHKDWNHLISNTFPFIFLGWSLFYFYRQIAWKALLLIYFTTGLWVWMMARPAFHIGASGVVYGLVSFLFISGILRRDTRLLAVTFVVTFLYGGLIWGLFPDLFPFKNISWESHLMGFLSGFIWGIYFKEQGPQRKMYSWELEDDSDEIIDNQTDEDVIIYPENVEESKPLQIIYHLKQDPSDKADEDDIKRF